MGKKIGATLPVFGERHGGSAARKAPAPPSRKPRKIGSGLSNQSAPAFVAVDEEARTWDRDEYQRMARQKAWRQTTLMMHAPTTVELALAAEKDRLARLYGASYSGKALARRHVVERRVEALMTGPSPAFVLRPVPMCRCGHGQATHVGQNGDGRMIPMCRSCALAVSDIWTGTHSPPSVTVYIPGMPGMTSVGFRAEMGVVSKSRVGAPSLPKALRRCPKCKKKYVGSTLTEMNKPCPDCLEKRFKAVVALRKKGYDRQTIATALHLSVKQIEFEIRRWKARKEIHARRRREALGRTSP